MAQTAILIIFGAVCLCFAFSFASLSLQHHKKTSNIFLATGVIWCIAGLCLQLSLPDFYDFITAMYLWEFPTLLILSGIIYFSTQKFNNIYKTALVIFILAELGSMAFPSSAVFVSDSLPFWADRLIIISLWTIYALSFQILTKVEGISGNHALTVFTGIAVLPFIGGAPILLGAIAACGIAVFAAWQIYNTYPARLNITPASSYALGFILAWFCLKTASEGALSCTLVLNSLFFYEVLIAVLRKLSLRPNYQNITQNTDFYQAGLDGFSPQDITAATFKISVLLIVFNIFAVFAPNPYSIPMFTFLISMWFAYRLKNWQEKIPTLRELPQTIMTDIKNNVSDIKTNIQRDEQK